MPAHRIYFLNSLSVVGTVSSNTLPFCKTTFPAPMVTQRTRQDPTCSLALHIRSQCSCLHPLDICHHSTAHRRPLAKTYEKSQVPLGRKAGRRSPSRFSLRRRLGALLRRGRCRRDAVRRVGCCPVGQVLVRDRYLVGKGHARGWRQRGKVVHVGRRRVVDVRDEVCLDDADGGRVAEELVPVALVRSRGVVPRAV